MRRQQDRNYAAEDAPPFRIALYSHDTCGLGHMRRNLLIAETLVNHFDKINILLLTGAREVAAFRYPAGVDAITLPSLYKEKNEAYRPRSLTCDTSELIRMRSRIIKTSIEMFEPDVFIVDKVPRGTMGELDETLSYLAARPDTHCVLGLRDILDQPEVVCAEWSSAGNVEAIERYYDAVWVYGDDAVYDARTAYNFPPSVVEKMAFTGYLDPSTRLRSAAPSDQDKTLLHSLGDRFFMCAVGGGQDGADLAEAFALATFPEGVKGLVVTGPHMPADAAKRLNEIAESRPHITCVSFLSEPIHYYKAAERVVMMGGYNTTLEVVGLGAHALIVPRIYPREEQLIRSRALHALGLVDMLHPENLTAGAITDWFGNPPVHASYANRLDMDGLLRIPALVQNLARNATDEPTISSKSEKKHAVA